MDEVIKAIGQLPQSLSPLATIAFFSVLAVVIGVSWRGILKGREADPAKGVPAAQVAAVIVDPTALNAATAALNKHTIATESHTDAVDRQTDMLDRVREEIRELSREVARRN